MSIVADAVLEAVESLRAYGYVVEPWSNSYPLWLVDGETLTDGELLTFALHLRLMDSPAPLQ